MSSPVPVPAAVRLLTPLCTDLIVLIGYRGSGKTTVGRVLAQRLDWTFHDCDDLIEARAGKKIPAIFAEDGELAFRNLESEVIDDVCGKPHQVIATGGGVVMREANRERMLSAGFVVWLRAHPAVLWSRIQQDPSTPDRRPNLLHGGLEEVEELLRKREPLYQDCAHAMISTIDLSPELVAEAILKAWNPSKYS